MTISEYALGSYLWNLSNESNRFMNYEINIDLR